VQLLITDGKVAPSMMGSSLAKYLVESAVINRHNKLPFLARYGVPQLFRMTDWVVIIEAPSI
jgi:hypothetical protein